MLPRILIILVTICIAGSTAFAGDFFLLAVDASSPETENALGGYPGRSWGKTADRIYLAGGEEDICWLYDRGIAFRTVEIEEPSSLYLCFGDAQTFASHADRILDAGGGYVLAQSPLPGADSYRRLDLRSLPFGSGPPAPSLLPEYDPVIADLIAQVDVDSLEARLRGLSGEDPVIISGQPYTINTRYAGTDDNQMAAQYIKEILEGYGYQVEFHGFYSGEPRHVAAYDENLAWLVTEDSDALRTTNGGATWENMPDNASSALWGVTNVGPDSVWLTGNDGVIRFSSNGGDSFVSQSSGTNAFLFGVFFLNPLEGWIAGDGGRILHTTNAGQSWSSQATPTSYRLYDVCFVDADNGWAVGRNGTIIHTTNGGTTWSSQTSNTVERLYSVAFTDASNGWVVGWSGVVRRTTNGGASWQTVNLGTGSRLYHVDFPTAQDGCIVGYDGRIYTTADGGDNWTQQDAGTQNDFYGVDFSDSRNGFAVGDGIIEKTTDGGVTWINQTGGAEVVWPNIIATKPGTVSPDEQVIICGHMDDRSEQPYNRAPGADDNGSGTTATIEAARIFAGIEFEKTIKFCLWNAEELGLLGSAAYVADAYARGDNIVGVYNVDMIAWDGNGDYNGELHCGTMSSSQQLGHILEGVVTDYGINLDTDFLTYGSIWSSDHASFWDYNYPAILGIEDYSSDFNPYYHSTGDNVTHVMWDYLTQYTRAAVGATATFAVPTTTTVSVEIVPDDPPVIVPRGGFFTYTGTLTNNTDQPQITDVWVMADVPGYGSYGPVKQIDNVSLSPNEVMTLPGVRQDIPDFAPLGTYTYTAYCGDYPSAVIDSSSFEFEVIE